jgi:hypothetical protein
VAVVRQVPERLVDIKIRHGLSFKVASDLGNALGRRLGILYTADEASLGPTRQAPSSARPRARGPGERPNQPSSSSTMSASSASSTSAPTGWSRTEAEPVLEAVRDINPLVPAE